MNDYYIKNGVAYITASNTGSIFLVDAEEWEKIKKLTWHEGANGYIQSKNRTTPFMLLHRIIASPKEGLVVDHINHNKRDNRKENLRVCTYSDNALNRKKLPKGISAIKRGDLTFYIVQLKGKSKSNYRGCYKTYEEAKEKRDKILKEEYGRNYL